MTVVDSTMAFDGNVSSSIVELKDQRDDRKTGK